MLVLILIVLNVLLLTRSAWSSPARSSSPRADGYYRGHGGEWWHYQVLRQKHMRQVLQSRLDARAAQVRREAKRMRQLVRAGSFGSHWLERAFLCIHAHEGSWQDPNAPYYGGVQMDYGFARTYGPEFLRAWGTPDHWPISVQLAVAMKAYLSGRGFGPWPNTRRMCGI